MKGREKGLKGEGWFTNDGKDWDTRIIKER